MEPPDDDLVLSLKELYLEYLALHHYSFYTKSFLQIFKHSGKEYLITKKASHIQFINTIVLHVQRVFPFFYA